MPRTLEPHEISATRPTAPPFLHLPPARLFALRAERLAQRAPAHPLEDYLNLIATLAHFQQRLLDQPPSDIRPDPDTQRHCLAHGLPPLSADSLVRQDAWQTWLDALLMHFPTPTPAVEAALQQLREASAGQRRAWAIALLAGQYGQLPAAVVPFLGAALQAAFSHALLHLEALPTAPPVPSAQCPCCGSPAMIGSIHHRGRENGLRYLVCALCACEWHRVRVNCIYCDKSEGLSYLSLASDRHTAETAAVRAECCPSCRRYLKLVYLEHDAQAEPLSADLDSLLLDMKLTEEGWLREAPDLVFCPSYEA